MMTRLTVVTMAVAPAVVDRGDVVGISALVDVLVVTLARFLELLKYTYNGTINILNC